MPTLAIIGAGSLRHSPAVIASLANYFGERELRIRLYDPIPERLELFGLLAQHCLVNSVSSMDIESFEYPEEALHKADLVIIQVDQDSARKFAPEASLEAALSQMLVALPDEAEVLSLLGEEVSLPLARYQVLNWPEVQDDEYRRAMPHQVLRWVRKEDSIHAYLSEFERSPLKLWLEDPSTVPMISREP